MATHQKHLLLFILPIYFYLSSCGGYVEQGCDDVTDSKGTKDFIDAIFKKYANNDTGLINETAFDALVRHLGVGVVIKSHESHESGHHHHHQHPAKHPLQRHKREIYSKKNSLGAEQVNNNGVNVCLQADSILSKHGVNKSKGISKITFARLCPSLVQQLDSEVCKEHAVHTDSPDDDNDGPSKPETWGYGFLAISLINLLSLSVIVMIPCLKKSFYAKVMSYLVALGVGTLSGDALLHLIPHAFVEGANAATGIKISEEDELKQHFSQVSRALFVLLGIYAFYFVEIVMKMRGGGHGHSHSHSHGAEKSSVKSNVKNTSLVESPVVVNKNALSDSLAADSNGISLEVHSDLKSNDKLDNEDLHIYVPRKQSLRSPGEKQITKETRVATVAWVVIVGDGFHNFSDGLAIGAAFSASLSSGLSTAIAVFCHELPHELGDFAILLNSGMTIKQAIVYNFVSAILAYVGLIVGILAGQDEIGRHFILSITAGLFLYISLADLLPALTNEEVPNQSKWCTYLWQHLGILTGIVIMLLISLFEHSLEHAL